MYRHKKILLTLFIVFCALAHMANAQTVGPVDPSNGFPVYYQDQRGLALALCLDPVNCVFDPVNPVFPFSVTTGFGAEAFWWGADAIIPAADCPACVPAVLVLALEAAYGGFGDPVDGQQVSFSRVRIRVDAPVAGTYTVTHPYGVEVFDVVTPGVRSIDFTNDVGIGAPGTFTGALAGPTFPFLTQAVPPPPPGFIGNALGATVTGSPDGTNFFRVEGPPGSNLDGLGNNVMQTNLFSVQGQIFSGVVPMPLTVQRSTYARAAAGGQVDVFATSSPAAAVDVSGGAVFPVTPLAGDADGFFFAHISLSDASVLPATVTVTVNRGLPDEAQVTKNLTDVVLITKAEYDTTLSSLIVEAASGDQLAPPTLTVSEFAPGTMTPVAGSTLSRLVVGGLIAPPYAVTVTSSAGGQDSANVAIVTQMPPVITSAPVTSAAAEQLYSYQVTASDPNPGDVLSYSLTVSPAGMTVNSATGLIQWTPTAAQPGIHPVTVSVADPSGLSATQSFNITVPLLLHAPVITSTPVTTALAGQLYTYQMTATDLNPADSPTFSLDTPAPAGMTINSATGLIQWTPTLSQTGAQAVFARVTDSSGLFSTQSYTVTVGVNALNSISGIVTDRNNAPIPGVTISLIGPVNSTVTTDASGAYIFSGLPNGTYEVIPSFTGLRFNPVSKDVTISGVGRTQNFRGESRTR
ncbi:MAG: carboxypeptidase regulatory-like domain-containing protein [Nitrospirae bacterium]|nr:carboxypeptidase regulatory-like domain-containing protein [Nitrospirota bacterium]